MSDNSTVIQFPCQFPIKIMGKSSLEFQSNVLQIIRKYAPDLGEAAVETRYSKDQHYISLTTTINAKNQEQLDNIYRELSARPEILMVI